MNYSTYHRPFSTTIKSSTPGVPPPGAQLWPAACVLERWCMSVNLSWCSNLNRREFLLLRMLCMLYVHTEKSWAFSDLVAAISAALHETFVHSRNANSVSQFLLLNIECELFAVSLKILFDNWRRFCRPSVIYVPLKCPRGGGISSPE